MTALENLAQAILDGRVSFDAAQHSDGPNLQSYWINVLPGPTPETTPVPAVEGLSPLQKVALIEAMGFQRVGSDHQPDCAYAQDEGLVCACVPPADTYSMPDDVEKFLNQDWDSRLESAKSPRPISEAER